MSCKDDIGDPVFAIDEPLLSLEQLQRFRLDSLSSKGRKCMRCGLLLLDDEPGCAADGPLCIFGQLMEEGT